MTSLKKTVRISAKLSMGNGEAYRIVKEGEDVGGVIVRVDGSHCELEILFVSLGVKQRNRLLCMVRSREALSGSRGLSDGRK